MRHADIICVIGKNIAIHNTEKEMYSFIFLSFKEQKWIEAALN